MQFRNFSIAIVLSSLVVSTTSAQLFRSTSKVGTTAAQFLKIGASARALGMGSAYVAMPGDVYSAYWNPAGLSRFERTAEVTFNHAEWLADVKYDYAAGMITLGEVGTVAASLISMRVPEDIVRTVEFPEGDGRHWDANSLALGLSYARNLTDRFSIGFNFKFISENVWNESAQGVALDFGTLYITPFHDLKIGASISNFGTKMQLKGQDSYFNWSPAPVGGPQNIPSEYRLGEYDLPLMFRIGVAMDLYRGEMFRATAAVDATHPNDNTEYVNSGVELSYREVIFARAGYKSLFLRDSEQSLTWGVGVRYDIVNSMAVKFDYAYADYGRLKNIQYFNLSLVF